MRSAAASQLLAVSSGTAHQATVTTSHTQARPTEREVKVVRRPAPRLGEQRPRGPEQAEEVDQQTDPGHEDRPVHAPTSTSSTPAPRTGRPCRAERRGVVGQLHAQHRRPERDHRADDGQPDPAEHHHRDVRDVDPRSLVPGLDRSGEQHPEGHPHGQDGCRGDEVPGGEAQPDAEGAPPEARERHRVPERDGADDGGARHRRPTGASTSTPVTTATAPIVCRPRRTACARWPPRSGRRRTASAKCALQMRIDVLTAPSSNRCTVNQGAIGTERWAIATTAAARSHSSTRLLTRRCQEALIGRSPACRRGSAGRRCGRPCRAPPGAGRRPTRGADARERGEHHEGQQGEDVQRPARLQRPLLAPEVTTGDPEQQRAVQQQHRARRRPGWYGSGRPSTAGRITGACAMIIDSVKPRKTEWITAS